MQDQTAPATDFLAGHPRYKKVHDLNEGTFGVVMLALDTATNEQVCSLSSGCAACPLKKHLCTLCSVSPIPRS